MKIETVRIKNLRSFIDEIIHFDDYTCLVGPNGAGKSTVLFALNVFFREPSVVGASAGVLGEEDFHNRNTNDPIEITITFTDIEPAAVESLKHYVRGGKLIVTASAEFDPETKEAKIEQCGERNVMPAFGDFFRAYDRNAKSDEINKLYTELQNKHSELPKAASKDAKRDALRDFEEQHPNLCQLSRSADLFYGFTKGANRLEPFIQWVYVPAVKDATSEQAEGKNTALGKLLDRTVRSKVSFDDELKRLKDGARDGYQKMLAAQQSALDGISQSLTDRVAHWAHPDASVRLLWRADPKAINIDEPGAWIRAGDTGFEGDLGRFGHGLQRCYLFALLQELAQHGVLDGPRLILGCEEPELYQHPPQARHLANVIQKLSEQNAQVVITTHSPLFVTGAQFDRIRIVRRAGKAPATIRRATTEEVAAKLKELTGDEYRRPEGAQAKLHSVLQPQLSEMFFATTLVLVEGIEDAAYITAYLILTDRWEEFRRRGGHVVPADGKSKLPWAAVVADKLCIPHFIVFDADGNAGRDSRPKHEKDNRALLRHKHQNEDNLFPPDPIIGDELAMWPLDLREAIQVSSGKDAWCKCEERVRVSFGQAVNLEKSPLFVGSVLSEALGAGLKVPILESLASRLEAFVAR